jgi:CBS domain-containing protein
MSETKDESPKDDPRIDVAETDVPLDDLRSSQPEVDGGDAKSEAQADDAPEIQPEPAEPPPVPMNVIAKLPARAWPPRVIADLMTRKVITLPENEPVGELEAWMDRFRFRHLPVVGEGMKLVGIISRTDLLHAMLGVSAAGKPIEKANAETPAGAIMNKNVVTARPDAELTTACRVMLQEKLGCLPVILEDGTLVGILTGTDFARLSLEVLEQLEKRA